jgi:tetratricopeptide (TPR) repeat protein
MRSGRFDQARTEVIESLNKFPTTGRLWSIRIQLEKILGGDLAVILRILSKAIRRIPKSGELLTELAKLLIDTGNYAEAKNALQLSLTFTPQYWDSLQELLRLEMLTTGTPSSFAAFVRTAGYEPNYGFSYLYVKSFSNDDSVESMISTAQGLISRLPHPFTERLDISGFIAHAQTNNMPQHQRAKVLFD